MRRVAITGMGVVTALGTELEEFWANLLAGKSGISAIECFDASEFKTRFGGDIKDFGVENYIAPKEQRKLDPFCLYGIVAAAKAMEDSKLDLSKEDGERMGCTVSSGIGGLQMLQKQMKIFVDRGPLRFSPHMIPQMISNILAGHIAIRFGLKGPNFDVTTACASATHSLGEALRVIQHGEADIMVAGGAEGSLCELGVGGFNALRALSTRNDEPEKASRPFDLNRDGFVPADGAGILILEEWDRAVARGANIYCELAGYGRTCDAYHITAPDSSGEQAARAMRLAFEDAGCTADDVDYINAHGTSTSLNDKTETAAIKRALGEEASHKVAVSSTKGMLGHMLGAAGGVEAVACALALRDGMIPPTINYDTPDPECDLDYVPNTARKADVKVAMSNSLGFGGHNATICLKKA